MVLLRAKLPGQRIDQLRCELQLTLFHVHVFHRFPQFFAVFDLFGEVHRLQGENAVVNAESREVFMLTHDKFGDCNPPGVLHRRIQKSVCFCSFLSGTEVVGAIKIDRVDLFQFDEIKDIDSIS